MEKITWEDLYPAVEGTISKDEFRRMFAVQTTLVRLGQQVKASRKAQNLTQIELAKRAGTSQSAITRFENGAVGNVTVGFLVRVLDVLTLSTYLTSKD